MGFSQQKKEKEIDKVILISYTQLKIKTFFN
jgi:hypothetical protein